MTLANNSLFTSQAGPGSQKRFFSRYTKPVKFAIDGGAALLAIGTPVAFDTSTTTWKLFQNGGSNGIGTVKGFVWPEAIQLSAANEVLGTIMMRGRVHLDDIPIVSGYTLAQLKTTLQTQAPSPRELGLDIEGLVAIS